MAKFMRCRVVEEGVASTDRQEFNFILEEVDDFTRQKVTLGPIIEPNSLVGNSLRL
jgi:hypothetical protein